MANIKTKRAKAKPALPLLCCAVICERVLMEGKMASLIRVIDILKLKTPVLPPGYDGLELPMRVYMGFRKGDSPPGKHTCIVELRNSKGKVSPFARIEFGFDETQDANTAANGELPLKLKWSGFGMYQFELTLDGVLVGAIPLKVDEHTEEMEQ